MTDARRYLIPAACQRVEETINRSRFITTLGYAPSVAAARQFIDDVSSEFAGASHNCWAYVVGPPGSTGQAGMSDAGEPHGVAGRPMLTVLLHSGLGDVCAVVTRYFGGTLLGKGGLVKAYSGGVQLALQSLPTIEYAPKTEIRVLIEYAAVTPFLRLLPNHEAEVLEQEFATDVSYRLKLPSEQLAPFTHAFHELTNGQALIETLSVDR
jgi:uncharacterized YigZ family protein